MISRRRAATRGRGFPLWTIVALISTLQVVLVACIVGFVMWSNHTHAIRDLAGTIRDQVAVRIVDHLTGLLETPKLINATSAAAARAGSLDLRDAAELERYFLEQVRIHDSVTSVYFGNPDGGIAGAGREGPGGSLYYTESVGFRAGSFRKYAVGVTGEKGGVLTEVTTFDARRRPWYTSALSGGGPTWTGPYTLVTGQAATLSSSLPLHDGEGALLGVFSVDIFLPQISAFLSSLDLGTTGQAFLVDRQGLLIASSGADTPPYGGPAVEHPNTVVAGAASDLAALPGSLEAIDEVVRMSFVVDGVSYLGQTCLIPGQPGLDWLVVVALPESDYLGSVVVGNRAALIWAALATLLVVALSVTISHRGVRSIEHLARYAEAVELGAISTPPEVGRSREVHGLVRALEEMGNRLRTTLEELKGEIQERKDAERALRQSEGDLRVVNQRLQTTLVDLQTAQEQLVRRERMAATAELTATVAHRLNNMLAAIMGYAEIAREAPGLPDGVRDDLVALTGQGSEAAALVSQLMRFARGSSRDTVPTDAVSVAREALGSFRVHLPAPIHVTEALPTGPLPVLSDPTDLRCIFDNVLANAREALEGAGALEITLTTGGSPAGHRCELCGRHIDGVWAVFSVRDTGDGIPPEVWRRLFEPFSTTKSRSWRSGLGMAEVAGLLRQHGGHLTIETGAETGTTVRIYLKPAGEA